MNHKIWTVLWCCLFTQALSAQSPCQLHHQHHHRTGVEQARMENQLSGTRSDTLNVLHYSISLNLIDFIPQNLSGTSVLQLVPKIDNLQQIRLDLDNALTVSEVSINGSNAVFAQTNDILAINTNNPVNPSDTLLVSVTYSGHPPTASFGGFYFTNTHAYNLGVGIGIDPPTYGRSWFPCIDNFVEHSTYEFFITTANNRKAFCNGILQEETTNSDGTKTWHWRLFQSIPSYLASVAVSDYATIGYNLPSIGGNMVPVQLGDRANDTADLHQSFQHLPNAFHAFEEAWGPYAFDRVGFVVVPFNGGAMEHATNIAYPQFGVDGQLTWEHRLMAHEFAHHWFGDLVTCQTASDMWLNEGWASYNESYFLEKVYDKARYNTNIRETNMSVIQSAHLSEGYLPVANVPFDATYSTHVYSKGALVAHSLRGYLGDELFFPCMRAYLDSFAFKNASTAQFRDFLSQCSGMDLTDFFEDWAYSPGFTHFSIDSMQVAFYPDNSTNTTLHIRQRLYAAPHYYHHVPIDITFFDNNLQSHTERVVVDGGCTSINLHLPFYPVYAALDWDEKLADAITDQHRLLTTTGNQVFVTEKAEVDINNLSGQLLLHVAHHWVMPDRPEPALSNVRLSPNRYWTIDGYQTDNFTASAKLFYDGSTSGANSHLDNLLITGTENNLKLLYRLNSASNWQILTNSQYTINTGSSVNDKKGSITLHQVSFGEYALGYATNTPDTLQTVVPACIATSVANTTPPLVSQPLKIVPNPTQDSLTIEIVKQATNDTLVIIDALGKTITTTPLQGQKSLQLSTQHWTKGMYIVQVWSGKTLVATQKIVKQ